MDDIELGLVDSSKAQLIPSNNLDLTEEKVTTNFGQVTVGVTGNRTTSRQAFVTFHDLGLNANSCFQSFFQFSDMAGIADRFCIYHINAPGQEEDAKPFPESFVFPTMDDLAQAVASVVEHFKIRSFIGFGVGVGANILCRYALKNPKKVDCLILVNCVTSGCGWIEWGYQKMNISYLKGRGMTTFTSDYLMWHHFGKNPDQHSPDLVNSYRQYFNRLANPGNLAAYIQSYMKRVPLTLSREGPTLKCPVLQLVGAGSPFVNDTVELNGKLDPSISNWMKISDSSGLVLEEKPEKATEAILLFLQGLGHFPSFSHLKWVQNRQSSMQFDLPPSLENSPHRRASLPPSRLRQHSRLVPATRAVDI